MKESKVNHYTSFELLDKRREIKDQRLMRKRRTNPVFESQVQQAMTKLRGGKSFFEIRHEMGIKNKNVWDDIQHCIARSIYSPEKCAIEWGFRLQSQYQMAADLYKRAREKNDLKNEAAAILLMSKLTEQDFVLKKELGLIKPVVFEDGAVGYDDKEVQEIDVENEMRKKLDERILAKMELQRELEQSKSVVVLNGPQPERDANPMEQIALVEEITDGRKPSN